MVWHAHFGFLGGINDSNILDCNLLVDFLQGVGFDVKFVINGNKCV
jgi:hypothetical protein